MMITHYTEDSKDATVSQLDAFSIINRCYLVLLKDADLGFGSV